MATLAQVKAGKPQRKNFAGRPRSVASGISLPRKRQVIRRSEVLLDDQISLVRDVQDSLEKAMQELANAKTVEDVEFYRIKVNELKLQCDEMVLILQVIGKLNSELAYARLELEKLDKGDKNVAVIRKRVTWLEDRVENLLTRHKRSDTQSAMTSETTSYIYSENRQFQSPTHTGTEYELMNNQIGPSERSNSSIQFVKNIDNVEGFIDDDEIMKRSSIPSRTSSKLTQDGQLDVLDTVMKEPDDAPVRVKKQKRKKKTRRQKEMGAGDASTSRVSTDDEEEMVTIKPKSILKRPLSRGEADGREDDAKSEDSRSVRVCDKLPHEGGITDKLPIYKRDLTEVSVYPANSVTTTDEEFSDISQTDVLTDSQPEEDENSEDKSKSEAGIFMTESERESRQVVLKSPEQDGSKTAESKEETPKSRAESYWESDHHQFEFNENMNAILELDPLSYHAMGLAVPSTFTVSRHGESTELPWRQRRKGSDIPDVHKIALDALAKKIHKMWNKVEDAAVASTTFKTSEPATTVREATFLSNVESSLVGRQSSSPKQKSHSGRSSGKKSKDKSSKKALESPSLLPPIEGNKQDARSRLIVYHPKPIPPAQVLPLTRTNADKRYPRVSCDWNETLPEDSEPTLRIVNQMNVAKETNILVYKSKEKKRKKLLTPVSTREASSKTGQFSRDQKLDGPNHQASKIVAMMNGKRQNTVKLEKDSLKYKRVEEILDKLLSSRVHERRDAARHLGAIGCDNDEVLLELKSKIESDPDLKVKYEAAKSLVTLGFHDESAIKVIVANLMHGNAEVRQDLLITLMEGKDIEYMDRNMEVYHQLVAVLKGFCKSKDVCDSIQFNAAICLGCLGVKHSLAKSKLMDSLQTHDSCIKAKSLEILIRQMHVCDQQIIKAVLEQLKSSSTWKHRAAAARLLIYIGPHYVCDPDHVEEVFEILEHRLWDDSSKQVQKEIANCLISLGMRDWIWQVVEKKLEDDNDDIRAQGAIAVGVLDMKSDKVIRTLLEMLELDSSEFVRLNIIRTFAILGITEIKIMRSLRERERTEGPLAREAGKTLKTLTEIRAHQTPRTPPRSPTKSPSPNLMRSMLGI